MWFHLLSVAIFAALGSCLDFYGTSRAMESSSCKGPGCPCKCPNFACPPCPTPQLPQCFDGCGAPECPCINPDDKQRALNSGLGAPNPMEKLRALAISTVNVYPTGPICSAFNILPHMMVTINSCIAGKKAESLFVTLNTPKIESLKVRKIVTVPYDNERPNPVILVVDKPRQLVNYFTLPPRPIDSSKEAEIHKWEVANGGTQYIPTRTKVKSHRKCGIGEDLICGETYNSTVMGWNDIGTVLTETISSNHVVQGLYFGRDLYVPTNMIKYLPLYNYYEWLYKMVEKYY